MDLSGAAYGWDGGGTKGPINEIYHTYPTIMKLDTVPKYHSTMTHPLSSNDISIFSPENITFVI